MSAHEPLRLAGFGDSRVIVPWLSTWPGWASPVADFPGGCQRQRENVNRGYKSRVLRLTLLALEIIEAILDGRQPAELQLDDLLEGFPLAWAGQRLRFG